jgi:hypothetical protein
LGNRRGFTSLISTALNFKLATRLNELIELLLLLDSLVKSVEIATELGTKVSIVVVSKVLRRPLLPSR